MIKKIKDFIENNNLIPDGSNIVLGLSGGPDSAFLLHLLATLQKEGKINKLVAAHLDHEWRPESAKDAQFCREISKKYNIPLVAQKISDLGISAKFGGSKEEFGRHARRYLLEKVLKEESADFIALAHHAQDQQETFFIRLIRGTSLSGLTAMWPKHGLYIRPLLQTNKKDIINFLKKNNIPYIVDPSNEMQEFLRNRIRKNVIPALVQCDDRFDSNFSQTLARLKNTELFLQELTQEKFREIATEDVGTFYINLNQLLNLNPILQKRILVHWLIAQNVKFSISEGFLDEIIKFLKQPGSKKHQIHHDWFLVKKKGIAHIKMS